MLYAPTQGHMQDMVQGYVASRGYGPYYQRAVWEQIAPMPMPDSTLEWEHIWRYIDSCVSAQ